MKLFLVLRTHRYQEICDGSISFTFLLLIVFLDVCKNNRIVLYHVCHNCVCVCVCARARARACSYDGLLIVVWSVSYTHLTVA